jgi:hypothetical protein
MLRKPEFRGISLIVESRTTHSNLDGPISAKFHTEIYSLPRSTKAYQRAAMGLGRVIVTRRLRIYTFFMTKTMLRLTLATVILVPFAAAAQSDITGDWQGVLKTDNTKLRLVLHITAALSGTLAATIDSVDQDSPDIPVSAITFESGILKLTVAQVHGSFEGKFSKDGTEINGTWTEGKRRALKFKRVTDSTKVIPPAPIGGDWQGILSADGRQLHLVLHLNTTSYTRVEGTLYSIGQGANGIPVSLTTFKDNVLNFTLRSVHSSYVGTLSKDGNEIEGVWTQGQAFPLKFKRVAGPIPSVADPERPQNPI